MDAHFHDWLNLLLRFAHLIAGISWIGSSFYFIWMDSSFEVPEKPRHNVDGELFMVHGGFYYQVEKKKIAPGELPSILHWFKWEATLTWVTGFALLVVLYYMTGGAYLVDPAVSDITPTQASILGLTILVVSWFVYDFLWQTKINQKVLSIISLALVGGIVYGLCHTLSGRAAFIHVGAMFGTMMVLNVWVRILPNQQKMVDDAKAGKVPDYSLSLKGKKRSVHNTYFIFPVLFIMISNHYPSTYGHEQNWLVLIMLIVIGALTRHAMVTKNKKERWLFAPALIILAYLITYTNPQSKIKITKREGPIEFSEVHEIMGNRCLSCHSEKPTDDIFEVAPNDVVFDTEEQVRAKMNLIYDRAVVLKNMPLGNKTKITEDERNIIGQWIEQEREKK
jgi:uncharacterized membrane protein